MKIAVFGNGNLALKIASKAQNKGNETELIANSEVSLEGVKVISSDKMKGKYDAIVLTDEADNKLLSWQIAPFLKKDGFVLTFQPGSPEYQLRAELPNNCVVCGIYDDEKFFVERGAHSQFAANLVDAAELDNIAQKRFEKMAEAAFGGISSVAGCNIEIITSNEKWLNLMVASVKEFMAICAEEQVYDIKVNGYLPADLLTMKGFLKKKYPIKKLVDAVPDYSDKLPILEYEAICNYAKKDEVDVPICKTTLELLRQIKTNKISRGPQNIKKYF